MAHRVLHENFSTICGTYPPLDGRLGALGVTACSAKADDKSDSGTPIAQKDGGDSSTAADAGGEASTNPDSGSTGKPITSCTTATLFAGNPSCDAANPSERPAEGTGILADPPFQYGSLTFVGKTLYTCDTGEIWSVDTSVPSRVMHHVVGVNGGANVDIKFGSCAAARLGAIQGIEALPDGSLVAPDAFANSIVHIKNPADAATCTVESWAGTSTDTTFTGTNYPNIGDVDGPVGTSRIEYPTAITTDSAGTVFFYDGGKRAGHRRRERRRRAVERRWGWVRWRAKFQGWPEAGESRSPPSRSS